MAYASTTLSDPVGASPLISAALWVQQAMLGTVATTVAILAVATVGFLMLCGRVPARRGAITVFGCFILFGAPAIAAGLRALANRDGRASGSEVAQAFEPPPIEQQPSPRRGDDPYAGASVIQ